MTKSLENNLCTAKSDREQVVSLYRHFAAIVACNLGNSVPIASYCHLADETSLYDMLYSLLQCMGNVL